MSSYCLGPCMIFTTLLRKTKVESILAIHAPSWGSPLKENWRYHGENCYGYEQIILFTGIFFFYHGWPGLVDGNQPMASGWSQMTFQVPSNLSLSMTFLMWAKRSYQVHIYSYPWHFTDWTFLNQYLNKAILFLLQTEHRAFWKLLDAHSSLESLLLWSQIQTQYCSLHPSPMAMHFYQS